MATEEMHPVDEALKRHPSWEPPPGFARRVVVRASMESQRWPAREHPRRGGFLRAAAVGLAAAAGAYVIGVLLSALVASIVLPTFDDYARFMEVTARAIASRAVLVSWLCAALSLGFAASFVRHVRD